jgi:hypothetical protein
MSHALGEQDGERVGFLSHGNPGIPYAWVVSAVEDGEAVFHGLLKHMLVAKKERESHSGFLSRSAGTAARASPSGAAL